MGALFGRLLRVSVYPLARTCNRFRLRGIAKPDICPAPYGGEIRFDFATRGEAVGFDFTEIQPVNYTPTREEAKGRKPNLFAPGRQAAGGVSTLCQK